MRGTQGQSLSPIIALNVICLDAPLVAIAWQALFARTQHVFLPIPSRAALFATAWLIYLADRVGDSFSIPPGAPISRRQQFARRHRAFLFGLIGIATAADLVAILRLDRRTAIAGSIVGSGSAVYLVLNQFFGRTWSTLPVKEIAIGALFAGGVVASFGTTGAHAVPFAWFATLCMLNCISIAFWEQQLDAEQQRISLATRFSNLRALPSTACVALALIAISCAARSQNGIVLLTIATSSALLLLLNVFPLQTDKRTALADLVLLTPLLALPFAS
jgi:hypothetical protein